MPEARSHSIELLSTNRGVGMEITPPLSDLKQKLILGSNSLSDELRVVLVREPGKMFHSDKMSGWGILSSEITRANDKTRLRRLAYLIEMILDGYGYDAEVVDRLDAPPVKDMV